MNVNELVTVLGNNFQKQKSYFNLSSFDDIKVINTDTREIQKGDVFIALSGKNFDGHLFIREAIEKGASIVILEQEALVNSTYKVSQIVVGSALKAYQQIANWWRNKYKIPIIAITGSVGKTTTKELIAASLGMYGQVHKTYDNYNNEIGVPRTLLKLSKHHDYAVIEMGMRDLEEIRLLTKIIQPTIGIITNIGTAHIGRLGSKEAIAQAKCELLSEMSLDSIAILNNDDELLMKTAMRIWKGKTITYGLNKGDIIGKLINDRTLRVEGLNFPLPLSGRHNAINYLAALAVTKSLNLDWKKFTKQIKVEMPQGRSQKNYLPGDIILLDETYNAGLESMKAALNMLKDTPGKRHIAVLGAMEELGVNSSQFHREVGETAQALGIDVLYILIRDEEARAIPNGIKNIDGVRNIKVICCLSPEKLFEQLINDISEGDRILFKASNSVKLKSLVEQICKYFS